MKPTRARRLDRGRRSPSIYSRTESQKVGSSSHWLSYILLVILLSALVYVVFFSPLFKIGKVTTIGQKYTNQDEINSRVQKNASELLNNNLLTYRTGSLQGKIGELAGVKAVKVEKKFPHELKIVLTERTPTFSWETIGKKYLVDEAGTLTGDFEDRFKDFPTVVDTKNVPVTVGKQVVPASFSTFINDLNTSFNEYTGAKMTRIEVPEITSELKVISDAGWYVNFDTTRTAKNELLNLSRVLSEAKAKKKKLEYVDLRIDNRIFYK